MKPLCSNCLSILNIYGGCDRCNKLLLKENLGKLKNGEIHVLQDRKPRNKLSNHTEPKIGGNKLSNHTELLK